eukprot:TRINITY_DN48144_c0_g1_i1.p1 TRINITY_DN48144_c0_g1~~TRINITY_DN48144_c0_g1_i1.p1  ORF type:complete len:390 (+),score=111.48 TRINITY_DN48144_c0_g1_i1:95-1264(+)
MLRLGPREHPAEEYAQSMPAMTLTADSLLSGLGDEIAQLAMTSERAEQYPPPRLSWDGLAECAQCKRLRERMEAGDKESELCRARTALHASALQQSLETCQAELREARAEIRSRELAFQLLRDECDEAVEAARKHSRALQASSARLKTLRETCDELQRNLEEETARLTVRAETNAQAAAAARDRAATLERKLQATTRDQAKREEALRKEQAAVAQLASAAGLGCQAGKALGKQIAVLPVVREHERAAACVTQAEAGEWATLWLQWGALCQRRMAQQALHQEEAAGRSSVAEEHSSLLAAMVVAARPPPAASSAQRCGECDRLSECIRDMEGRHAAEIDAVRLELSTVYECLSDSLRKVWKAVPNRLGSHNPYAETSVVVKRCPPQPEPA